ncbi:hypothetical protein [Jannaschia seosinensis]|uniref:hypothetical protein n=1 Tax=Jannaschia seosinensis TaxID=313367 RepID=UPI000A5C7263|nr:hypothetical protein [Jannaschia seosinensis]
MTTTSMDLRESKGGGVIVTRPPLGGARVRSARKIIGNAASTFGKALVASGAAHMRGASAASWAGEHAALNWLDRKVGSSRHRRIHFRHCGGASEIEAEASRDAGPVHSEDKVLPCSPMLEVSRERDVQFGGKARLNLQDGISAEDVKKHLSHETREALPKHCNLDGKNTRLMLRAHRRNSSTQARPLRVEQTGLAPVAERSARFHAKRGRASGPNPLHPSSGARLQWQIFEAPRVCAWAHNCCPSPSSYLSDFQDQPVILLEVLEKRNCGVAV